MTVIEVVRNEAIKVFGTEAKANRWLNTINLAFGIAPIYLMETQEGAAEVMKVLSAIQYGGVV
jgi:uncharacterized protein (DUF2384 family)